VPRLPSEVPEQGPRSSRVKTTGGGRGPSARPTSSARPVGSDGTPRQRKGGAGAPASARGRPPSA
jgi:hypothetical protein